MRIQAAVNARGVIFFPPGQYLISAPLTFTQEWPGVQFMGCGSEQSMLFGGVKGYLIDRPTFDNTNSGVRELAKKGRRTRRRRAIQELEPTPELRLWRMWRVS